MKKGISYTGKGIHFTGNFLSVNKTYSKKSFLVTACEDAFPQDCTNSTCLVTKQITTIFRSNGCLWIEYCIYLSYKRAEKKKCKRGRSNTLYNTSQCTIRRKDRSEKRQGNNTCQSGKEFPYYGFLFVTCLQYKCKFGTDTGQEDNPCDGKSNNCWMFSTKNWRARAHTYNVI